jgi:hypothetical protein
MANSQLSFETMYGRFVNGNEFIQTLADFNPQKDLIKKTNLTSLIADIVPIDKAVNLKLKAMMDETNARKFLVFRSKECDENCLENRIRNIHSYIGADISKTCAAYKIIGGYIKKFAPTYKKKDPNLPPEAQKSKSPSEKSFVAMNGYGMQVLELITELGTDYAPQNDKIQLAKFEIFVKDLVDRAKSIAKLEAEYSDAVSARRPYYYGEEGILKRQTMIKGYLASFTGGKKSQNYIEYDRLIKGK